MSYYVFLADDCDRGEGDRTVTRIVRYMCLKYGPKSSLCYTVLISSQNRKRFETQQTIKPRRET